MIIRHVLVRWRNTGADRGRRLRAGLTAAVAASLACATPAAAQSAPAAPGWIFTAPDAASAWFATLDAARLTAPGALPFYRGSVAADPALHAALAAPAFEILHFVPLYYPSASRDALVRAVRSAAATNPVPPTPRAAFVVGALHAALPAASQRLALIALADAVSRQPPGRASGDANGDANGGVSALSLERWQREWNERFAPALAPYLASERLDGGVVMVVDALGAEGRLFAGRPADRTDNVAAVGTFGLSAVADAPLFALVRELCFPLVTRAGGEDNARRGSRLDAARRSGILAVRCGAELLDQFLPSEAAGYRAHWRQAGGASVDFDTLFPADSVVAPRLHAAIARLARSP